MKIAMISFLVFFNKDSGVMTQKLIGRMSSSQSSSCSNVLVGIDQMQADTEWGPISISIEIRSIAALFYFSSCAWWACVPVCCVPPLSTSPISHSFHPRKNIHSFCTSHLNCVVLWQCLDLWFIFWCLKMFCTDCCPSASVKSNRGTSWPIWMLTAQLRGHLSVELLLYMLQKKTKLPKSKQERSEKHVFFATNTSNIITTTNAIIVITTNDIIIINTNTINHASSMSGIWCSSS